MLFYNKGDEKTFPKSVHIFLNNSKYYAKGVCRKNFLSAEDFKFAYKKSEEFGWKYVGPLEMGVWQD